MATMSREQQQSAMTITFRIDHQLLYGSVSHALAWKKTERNKKPSYNLWIDGSKIVTVKSNVCR